MWRDAAAVLRRDLAIEAKSRVGLWQVLPFAIFVVVLFAFALGPSRSILQQAAPGLFWLGVLLSSILLVLRSAGIEAAPGLADAQRLLGVDPAGLFLGKAAAIAVQLVVLEVILTGGVIALLGYRASCPGLAVAAALLATWGLAVVGTLYGALSGGARGRETLLPMLVVPVLAPVLLAAVKSWQAAVSGPWSSSTTWLVVLGAFAVIYSAVGVMVFGQLRETM